jgi:hypothetical protein
MGKADPNISLDWTGYDSQEAAADPTVVKERGHGQEHFMDLDMWVKYVSAAVRTDTNFRVLFRPYRKPGNAYAYIPFNSFHGRHVFRGWITAEILRLLTHSSEWLLLKERLDLRLTELIKSTCGDIFPPKVFLAKCNPPKSGSILRR